MGFTINAEPGAVINNYDIHDNEVVNIGSIGGDAHATDEMHTEEEDVQLPVWEECIPAYLREGKLLLAWNWLRSEKILDAEYRLPQPINKSLAKFIAFTIFTKHCEIMHCKNAKDTEWRHFEKFWKIKGLRKEGDTIAKDVENKIITFFSSL